jgi:dUTPase
MIAQIQLDPGATTPTRAHETDVGYDVTSISLSAVLNSGARVIIDNVAQLPEFACAAIHDANYAISHYIVDTGVHLTPPPGYYFELVPNSRQAKTTVSWGNSIGVIDPTYTGSIKIIIKKAIYKDLEKYFPGNVVGQLILRPLLSCTFQQVDHLTPTDRADGGFGSTAH